MRTEANMWSEAACLSTRYQDKTGVSTVRTLFEEAGKV